MKSYLESIIPMVALKLIILVFFLLDSNVVFSQVEEDSTPTSETEIVCYAAQNKWVCAPADQKQRAHDKAMELVNNTQSNDISSEFIESPKVEIKTMDLGNDFSQQVKNLPPEPPSLTVVGEEGTHEELTQGEVSQSQESKLDLNSSQSNISKTSVQNTHQLNEHIIDVPNNNGQANDFTYWQNNFSEKWSFQVVGTSNRHHLDGFINRYGLLQTNHTIVKTQANSADWWVVLVGLHDSREQALTQRQQLPLELASQAWVRQIKTIIGQADQ